MNQAPSINPKTVESRIRRGMSFAEATTKPVERQTPRVVTTVLKSDARNLIVQRLTFVRLAINELRSRPLRSYDIAPKARLNRLISERNFLESLFETNPRKES